MSIDNFTTHQLCDALRDRGCAVTVFLPEELAGASADQVEDLMCERGWDAIETLREVEEAA